MLEGALTSHLPASRQEHTRHMGICSILEDLGGPGFFHNSFQSLNTLASGNSSLYLTYRPLLRLTPISAFFCLQSGWRTAVQHPLCTKPPPVTESHLGILGCFSLPPATKSLNQTEIFFVFVSCLFLFTPFDYKIICVQ